MERTIVVDVDNVIVDTVKAFTAIHNLFRPDNHIDYTNVVTYGFSELSLGEYLIRKIFKSTLLWDHMELKKGVVTTINKWQAQGYNVVFATRGSYQNIINKLKFLNKFFKDIPVVPFIQQDSINAQIDKDVIRSFIVIDDSIKVLEKTKAVPICFRDRNYEWSKNWEGLKATSWENLDIIVQELMSMSMSLERVKNYAAIYNKK